jgi:hypothetical protein
VTAAERERALDDVLRVRRLDSFGRLRLLRFFAAVFAFPEKVTHSPWNCPLLNSTCESDVTVDELISAVVIALGG